MDSRRLAQTRAGYDPVARAYAASLPDTSFEAQQDMAMVDRFAGELPPSATVLDAGCGAGRMLAYVRSRVAGVTLAGVDLSARMLDEARRADPLAELTVADIADLPYADDSVDGVLAWYSIIHTPSGDLPALAAELHRVTRPGGVVLIGFQSGTGRREIAGAYGHDVALTAFLHRTADVADALVAAGFAIDTVLDREPRTTERHPQGFVLARAR
ncbi:class I SAM-dependent methyltransferase [Demequina soli]|uniref:class I SAM-dependent methyltransferase n=1 Tax=Demequina soli TaxID=1638987 RepID=UPI0007839332|nr:class I SAM-dependent methyltransferase [Demequina soli]